MARTIRRFAVYAGGVMVLSMPKGSVPFHVARTNHGVIMFVICPVAEDSLSAEHELRDFIAISDYDDERSEVPDGELVHIGSVDELAMHVFEIMGG